MQNGSGEENATGDCREAPWCHALSHCMNAVTEGWQGCYRIAVAGRSVEIDVAQAGQMRLAHQSVAKGGRGFGTETDGTLSPVRRRDVRVDRTSCNERRMGEERLCKTAVGSKCEYVTPGKCPWCHVHGYPIV